MEAIYLFRKTKSALSRRKVPVFAWLAIGWGKCSFFCIFAISSLLTFLISLYLRMFKFSSLIYKSACLCAVGAIFRCCCCCRLFVCLFCFVFVVSVFFCLFFVLLLLLLFCLLFFYNSSKCHFRISKNTRNHVKLYLNCLVYRNSSNYRGRLCHIQHWWIRISCLCVHGGQ